MASPHERRPISVKSGDNQVTFSLPKGQKIELTSGESLDLASDIIHAALASDLHFINMLRPYMTKEKANG